VECIIIVNAFKKIGLYIKTVYLRRHKTNEMKKLLTVLAVAVAMTACNNSGESADAAKAPADTIKAAAADSSGAMKSDSSKMTDTSMKMSADTSAKMKAK
jgi:hypothetical protein